MDANSLNKHEVKKEIEDFLSHGIVFDYVLKKNTSLFFDKLKKITYNNYWFEYEKDNIIFSKFPKISEVYNSHGDLFYSYINDFKFSGYLCYSDYSHHDHKINIIIEATLRLFKSPGHEINLSDRTNHIEVWDESLKTINLLKINTDKQIKDLDLMPYDYSFYTETWSKIDKSDLRKERQIHVTSSYYLHELIESYDRIKHLLSFVLLNSSHACQYTVHKQILPENYKFEYIYEISENFKLYDRYYLTYCELTIESLYKFWERVGFYLFQFFKPINNKVNDNNLSFYKLIQHLRKEYSTNEFIRNDHFDWFVSFVLDSNSSFSLLTNYRHPFVHYKFDDFNNKTKGGLISTTLNYWLENMSNKQKLDLLAEQNKLIKLFLIEQFELCKVGFKHAIKFAGILLPKQL